MDFYRDFAKGLWAQVDMMYTILCPFQQVHLFEQLKHGAAAAFYKDVDVAGLAHVGVGVKQGVCLALKDNGLAAMFREKLCELGGGAVHEAVGGHDLEHHLGPAIHQVARGLQVFGEALDAAVDEAQEGLLFGEGEDLLPLFGG